MSRTVLAVIVWMQDYLDRKAFFSFLLLLFWYSQNNSFCGVKYIVYIGGFHNEPAQTNKKSRGWRSVWAWAVLLLQKEKRKEKNEKLSLWNVTAWDKVSLITTYKKLKLQYNGESRSMKIYVTPHAFHMGDINGLRIVYSGGHYIEAWSIHYGLEFIEMLNIVDNNNNNNNSRPSCWHYCKALYRDHGENIGNNNYIIATHLFHHLHKRLEEIYYKFTSCRTSVQLKLSRTD